MHTHFILKTKTLKVKIFIGYLKLSENYFSVKEKPGMFVQILFNFLNGLLNLF